MDFEAHIKDEDVEIGKGLSRLINLIDYYFSRGGMQMQFNVVSRETLLRAQKDQNKCKRQINL